MEGPRGFTGPDGIDAAGVLRQPISIAWQNDESAGADRESFQIPDIGRLEVRCSPEAQWLRLFPNNLGNDVAMWTTRLQQPAARGEPVSGTEAVVRTARRGYNYPDPIFEGPDVTESMSVSLDGSDPKSTGSFIGQISTAGPHTAPGGPGPRATTFQLGWHWNFEDGANRCFVSGALVTAS
jgi:hypothetical protein